MKLVKSLLLGSVAGLAAVAGAQAADLPSRKAAPVEYVRICSTYGAGFFFIPGTDTCLRISGRVRAEYRYTEPFARADNATGFRARGRLNIDARTATAYGTLRTFIRYELTANTGNYGGFTTDLEKGFIQFAGITAGRAQSFFDFYDLYATSWGTQRYGAVSNMNLLAYTATFGGGFSATLSMEDNTRRNTTTTAFANAITYGGTRMPEIVASLNVDQAWGSAALRGAVHQIFALNRDPLAAYVDTEYGYAIGAGVKINLPMIAAGDEFLIDVVYSEGAISYTGGSFGRIGGVSVTDADALVDAFGNVKKTKAFSVAASFLHYWTPQIRQAVWGSYARYDYAASVTSPLLAGGARAVGAVTDTTEWRIATNLIWSPVRGMDIGVEVLYARLDPRGRIRDANVGGLATKGDDDAFEARLRFQRDF